MIVVSLLGACALSLVVGSSTEGLKSAEPICSKTKGECFVLNGRAIKGDASYEKNVSKRLDRNLGVAAVKGIYRSEVSLSGLPARQCNRPVKSHRIECSSDRDGVSGRFFGDCIHISHRRPASSGDEFIEIADLGKPRNFDLAFEIPTKWCIRWGLKTQEQHNLNEREECGRFAVISDFEVCDHDFSAALPSLMIMRKCFDREPWSIQSGQSCISGRFGGRGGGGCLGQLAAHNASLHLVYADLQEGSAEQAQGHKETGEGRSSLNPLWVNLAILVGIACSTLGGPVILTNKPKFGAGLMIGGIVLFWWGAWAASTGSWSP